MDDALLLLSVHDLTVRFDGRTVLECVEMDLHAGEIVTLIGPNGAGKTTLVRVVLGLMQPDRGKVYRRPGMRIGYMPQRLRVDPVLPITVRRFLLLAGRGVAGRLSEVVEEVGVGHVLDAPLQHISGGEMQRVMLARALLRAPELLVLDEPVQGVDVNGQEELYGLISRIRDRHGCGILMVSHDLHLVMASTDRVVCLNHHVCCSGSPESVTQHPAYRDLFGSSRFAIYTHHHDHLHDLHGDVVRRPAEKRGGRDG